MKHKYSSMENVRRKKRYNHNDNNHNNHNHRKHPKKSSSVNLPEEGLADLSSNVLLPKRNKQRHSHDNDHKYNKYKNNHREYHRHDSSHYKSSKSMNNLHLTPKKLKLLEILQDELDSENTDDEEEHEHQLLINNNKKKKHVHRKQYIKQNKKKQNKHHNDIHLHQHPPFQAISSRKEGQEFISKRKSKNYGNDKYRNNNPLFVDHEKDLQMHSHSYSGKPRSVFSNS